MTSQVLYTERLVLRRWTDDDREPFAHINADPAVMQYRFRTLSREDSDELIDSFETGFDEHGFSMWAVQRRLDGRLIGSIGLEVAGPDMPFRPLVHIGWQLAFDTWHWGYATEGATAAVTFAFQDVGLAELVSHTTAVNQRSRAVMERLGMTHDPADDFDGPWYPDGHPHRRFVLYRLLADRWPPRPSEAATSDASLR